MSEFLPFFNLPSRVGTLEDLMAFDRSLCARGYKKFLRPCHPADFPPGFGDVCVQHVLVEEAFPGCRRRQFVKAIVLSEPPPPFVQKR